jgi:ferredoxin, 2Fe-2S
VRDCVSRNVRARSRHAMLRGTRFRDNIYKSLMNMPKITFISFSGESRTVEVASGTSLMRAATDNRVDGIDGDCGGNCACATCHVYIDPGWLDRVGARTPCEVDMLNLVAELRDTSRLACQIDVDASLDGLIVATPESQH